MSQKIISLREDEIRAIGEAFADKLRAQGYEKVELIHTDSGMFMSRSEGKVLGLSGSTLLVGRK